MVDHGEAKNDEIIDISARDINKISIEQIPVWLAAGWQDIWRRPFLSLGYGLIVTTALLATMALMLQHPLLIVGYLTGILLIGAFLATGFYAISQANAQQARLSFWQVLIAWRINTTGFALFALLLGLILIAWLRVTSLIVAINLSGYSPSYEELLDYMLTPQGLLLAVTLGAAGGILAALCFILSVVSLPMLASERANPLIAILTSIQAVRVNPWPMVVWAATILVLIVLGLATLFGLFLVLPLLGHASWHAYRNTVHPLDEDSGAGVKTDPGAVCFPILFRG